MFALTTLNLLIREPHPDDVGDDVNDDDVDDGGGGSNNEDDDLDEDDGAASPPPDAVYEEEEDEDEPNGGDGDAADRVGSAHDPAAAAADGSGDISEDQVFHHSADDHPSASDIFGKKHRPLVRKLYPDITGLVISHTLFFCLLLEFVQGVHVSLLSVSPSPSTFTTSLKY